MIKSVNVIGRGRVGSALAARLEERGVELREDAAELTLLCVPDTAIRDVARGLSPGQGWVGHVSGATPLSALDPHELRFSLHPLQTFTRARGPEQLDAALFQARGKGRPHAAATHHVDALDHQCSSSVADTGRREV